MKQTLSEFVADRRNRALLTFALAGILVMMALLATASVFGWAP